MALKLKKKGPAQRPVKKTKTKVKAGKSKRAIQKKEVPVISGQYIEGIGRRKVATARVRIYPKFKDFVFVVNDQLASDYFSHEAFINLYLSRPFEVVGLKNKQAVSVKISGSGVNAQIDAIIHGLARALVEFNPEYKPLLRRLSIFNS